MIDRIAKILAARRGCDCWEGLDESDRTQFRLDALAVLSELGKVAMEVGRGED